MSAPPRHHPEEKNELDAPLGRSLAETERLNRPGHRAGEQARAAVERQTSMGASRRRALVISIAILLALIALVGLLVRITQG